MPLLAIFLGGMFQSLVAFLAAWIGKRVALTAAVLIAFSAVTVVFVGAITALAAQIVVTIPDEVSIAWSWIMPDSVTTCLSLVIATYAARWAYDWTVTVITVKAGIWS